MKIGGFRRNPSLPAARPPATIITYCNYQFELMNFNGTVLSAQKELGAHFFTAFGRHYYLYF